MPIKKQLLFAGGCLMGAVGMYYSDPHRGAYRRATLKSKSTHFRNVMIRKSGIAGRDLGHRALGVISAARIRVFPEPVSDEVLVARVSSKVGRIVANPHSIHVSSEKGRVFLTGPLFSDEVEPLLHLVGKIPGVRFIEKRLEPHRRTERVPGLQGHRRHRAPKPPALGLLIGLAGGVAASILAIRQKAS